MIIVSYELSMLILNTGRVKRSEHIHRGPAHSCLNRRVMGRNERQYLTE